MNIKHSVVGGLVLMLAFISPVAGAPSLTINMQQPSAVQWPQDTISLSQLQNLFSQNPGAQQFQIQFPNGLSWNVSPAAIESLYNEYSQKATALGYGQLPDLSFSSLNSTVLNPNMATIPIRNAMSAMQQESDAALDALQTQESGFWNSLPDWLQNILQMIGNGFMTLWEFARDEVRAWF